MGQYVQAPQSKHFGNCCFFLAHHNLKISTNIRIHRCLEHRHPETCKHNTKHKGRKLQCAHKAALSEKAGAIGAMGKKKVSGTRAHTDSHSHRHEASETEREREKV